MQGQRLAEEDLCRAVAEMSQGLVDANLGGALFKKRLPRIGQGKRGGFRTIVAKPSSDTWLFLYGFAKSDLGNISAARELVCRCAAKDFLSLTPDQRKQAVERGDFFKVNCHA
jgi:hypothetical protein